jgi:plasmid stability protein
MANLTIALDDEILRRARLKALQQGTSVNALLREYLVQYAGTRSAQEQAAKRFLQLAAKSKARRGARRFSRDELHER